MHTWERAFSGGQAGLEERDVSLKVPEDTTLCNEI